MKAFRSQQNPQKPGGLKNMLGKNNFEMFYKQLLLQRAASGTA